MLLRYSLDLADGPLRRACHSPGVHPDISWSAIAPGLRQRRDKLAPVDPQVRPARILR
jgi:hypothetical protein